MCNIAAVEPRSISDFAPLAVCHELDLNTEIGDATYMQFRELPFCRLVTELVRPTRMIKHDLQPGLRKVSLHFRLSANEAYKLCNERYEVLLRIGYFVPSLPQSDKLNDPIYMHVNGIYLPLDAVVAPINITTPLVLGIERDDPISHLQFTWLPTSVVTPCFSVQLVRKMGLREMFNRMRFQLRPVPMTDALNSRRLLMDENIELMGPSSGQHMRYPCRAITCSHLECFDCLTFLSTVSRSYVAIWRCPICRHPIKWDDLFFFNLTFEEEWLNSRKRKRNDSNDRENNSNSNSNSNTHA